MTATPMIAGHYWAKWKSSDEGTDPSVDYSGATAQWEVVEVVRETFEDSPDKCIFSVLIPGVAGSQTRHAFFWGPGPLNPPPSNMRDVDPDFKERTALARYKEMTPAEREEYIARHTQRVVTAARR